MNGGKVLSVRGAGVSFEGSNCITKQKGQQDYEGTKQGRARKEGQSRSRHLGNKKEWAPYLGVTLVGANSNRFSL